MGKIEAEKIDINKLFSGFWFTVPEFQRSFLWQRDNVSVLLDDLWFAFENKSDMEYFLGSLVLQKRKEKIGNENDIEIKVYDILDGQQRLTTLLMLMAVLRDLCKNEDNIQATQEAIFQSGSKVRRIPERLRITYKIRDNVEEFIKQFILQKAGTRSSKLKGEKETKNISISNMAKAILCMHEFFGAKKRKDVKKFEEFIDFLFNDVVFIYVATENRGDAFKLFTIINARGIPLTNANILKAINIGAIEGDEEKERYAEIWESIENELGEESFGRFLSFIRTILLKEKARTNLLEEFEEKIYKKSKLKGERTLDIIGKYKEIYDRAVSLDLEIDNDYKNLITIMKIGLPSEDWIPPLLLFYEKFREKKLLEFSRKLEYKFSSDWILQYTPTQRIENMNSILKKIEKEGNPDEIIADGNLFEVDSKSLREALEGNIYGRGFARYILLKYEYLISDNTVHLSEYKYITVEHILPQNPRGGSQWRRDFTEEERDYWTHKLANLVLISRRKNTNLGNLDFEQKKERYLKGGIDIFAGSKVFIERQSSWTPSILERRQKEMLDELVLKGDGKG
jgi:uncharacterized protein with ParB-like and HNH nuclease domain